MFKASVDCIINIMNKIFKINETTKKWRHSVLLNTPIIKETRKTAIIFVCMYHQLRF